MAKSDADRGPIAAWMRRERRAHSWTDADMTRELAKRGVHILPASYRGMEAGPRPPSSQVRQALEAVFGSSAPDTKKEAVEPQPDSLITALAAQTAAIDRLVAAMTASGPALPDRVAERLAARLGLLPSPDAEDDPIESELPLDGDGATKPTNE